MNAQPHPDTREYTLPEGCVVCGADLPVKITRHGPRSVCVHCGWFGRPMVRVSHRGLAVELPIESA